MIMTGSITVLNESDLDAVSGGKNTIVDCGGGYSFILQTRANGSVSGFYVCSPTQCTDLTYQPK